MKNFFAKYFFAKQNTKQETFLYILTLFYLIPFGLMVIANMLFSLFQTTYMELYLDTEKPLYKSDSPLFLLLFAGLGVVLCFLFLKKKPLTPRFCRLLERCVLLYSGLLSLTIILLYRVEVACDSQYLSNLAVEFVNGDYSAITNGEYLAHYPFQLGMTGFIQLIYTLFGVENYIAMQLINTVAILCAVYFLHRIAEELFRNLQVQFCLSLLCIGLLSLYLSGTFIYGDVPALGLYTATIYLVIRYLNTGNRWLLIPAVLTMTPAIVLKNNSSIILIAAVIILLLQTLRKKDWFALLFAAALCIGPAIGNSSVNAYYMHAAGIEALPSGIPKIAWIAMGLQDNEYIENGWYNGYNWEIYSANNYDTAATTAACADSIKESLNRLISSPKSGIYFFYKKFISQWNYPTHHSQIITEWYSRYSTMQHPIAKYLIYDSGRFLLETIMNLHHFITLLGASVYAVRSIKNWSLGGAFLSLCVFGGYLFHLIWEAGGQYGLGYYVLCVPMAAYGFAQLLGLLQHVSSKHVQNRS